ncbi:MAG TPA: flagellar hook-basal body complex protein FliE [Kaistiaceae bacterium]|mgnify:FL=1|nr:flagellar hook-basal body complex protein FliE [Kaistiaceae bacterium]
MTTPLSAAKAYSSVGRLANQLAGNEKAAKATGDAGGDFGSMVKQAIGDVVEAGKVADQKALAAAQGKADVVDVVTAVAETEVALSTMVTVRDKVIAAYEEIMRMPI